MPFIGDLFLAPSGKFKYDIGSEIVLLKVVTGCETCI